MAWTITGDWSAVGAGDFPVLLRDMTKAINERRVYCGESAHTWTTPAGNKAYPTIADYSGLSLRNGVEAALAQIYSRRFFTFDGHWQKTGSVVAYGAQLPSTTNDNVWTEASLDDAVDAVHGEFDGHPYHAQTWQWLRGAIERLVYVNGAYAETLTAPDGGYWNGNVSPPANKAVTAYANAYADLGNTDVSAFVKCGLKVVVDEAGGGLETGAVSESAIGPAKQFAGTPVSAMMAIQTHRRNLSGSQITFTTPLGSFVHSDGSGTDFRDHIIGPTSSPGWPSDSLHEVITCTLPGTITPTIDDEADDRAYLPIVGDQFASRYLINITSQLTYG